MLEVSGLLELSAIPCFCSQSRNSPALMHKNKTNQTNRGEKGGKKERVEAYFLFK